jgi:hypothetical protein
MFIVKRLEQLSSGMLSQKTGTTLIRYSHSQKTRTTLIRYAQSKDWNNSHQVRSVKRLEQPSSDTLSQKTGTTVLFSRYDFLVLKYF